MKPIFVGALILGGAYFLLRDNIAQFMGTPAPAPVLTDPPAPTPTPAAPAATAAAVGTLAALKAHITSGGNGASLTGPQGPDTWNYYLNELYPAFTAPAPEALFPGKANVRDATTIDVWFSAVAPFLKSSGLSGAPLRIRAGRQAWS